MTPSAHVAPRATPNDPGQRTSGRVFGQLLAHPDVLLSVGLFAIALAPRLLYLLWAPVFIGGDSAQYFQPVYDLMTTGKFTLSLKRPPLYPWLLYAEQVTLGPSFVPLIALQHLLGAVGVVLTYWIGRLAWSTSEGEPPPLTPPPCEGEGTMLSPLPATRESESLTVGSLTVGRWAGGLAALLVALSGPTLRWEHFLMTEGLFAFLFTLTMLLMAIGLRRPGWWPWAAAGFVLGLAILTRSAGQIVFFIAPVMVLLIQRSWRAAIWKTGLLFAVCAIAIVPWMLRNQAVFGAFTTAGAAGQNLVTFVAIIHRPDFSFDEPLVTAVDADPKMAFARKQIKQEMEDKLARPNKDVTGLGIFNHIREATRMSEKDTDKAMQEIALRAILARPLVYARDVAGNVFDIFMADASTVDESLERHWRLWEEVSWNRPPLRRYVELPTPAQDAAYPYLAILDGIYQPARTAGLFLALFIVGSGLALVQPRHRVVLAISLAALGLIGIHAATVGVVPRYRVSVEPLIDVVAMGALVVLVRWGAGYVRRRTT